VSFFNFISGKPCLNCETDAAREGDLFCSQGCRAEFEGEGAFADE
jgi:hypothetical protein